MKTGAEPKKVAILAALLIVALVIVYFNYFAGGSETNAPAKPVASDATPPVAAPPVFTTPGRESAGGRRRTSNNSIVSEFKLRQGVEPGAEKPDPATIDPTLRLDLLAKLQKVELPASMRNIFQYGAAPPPADLKPLPPLPTGTKKIPVSDTAPAPKPPGPPPPPPAPTAPQITWKYYGYIISKSDNRKEAFLLDGEDIIIAGENDSVKLGRYKVVRIGVSSITIEDTQFKSTQTLQLQPDAAV